MRWSSGDGDEPVEVHDCVVMTTTDKAILVEVAKSEEVWVPRSLVKSESEIDAEDATKGDEGTLVVKKWWADDKGLG